MRFFCFLAVSSGFGLIESFIAFVLVAPRVQPRGQLAQPLSWARSSSSCWASRPISSSDKPVGKHRFGLLIGDGEIRYRLVFSLLRLWSGWDSKKTFGRSSPTSVKFAWFSQRCTQGREVPHGECCKAFSQQHVCKFVYDPQNATVSGMNWSLLPWISVFGVWIWIWIISVLRLNNFVWFCKRKRRHSCTLYLLVFIVEWYKKKYDGRATYSASWPAPGTLKNSTARITFPPVRELGFKVSAALSSRIVFF